jgi:hypothetical protein
MCKKQWIFSTRTARYFPNEEGLFSLVFLISDGFFSSGFLIRRKKINVKARHTKVWRDLCNFCASEGWKLLRKQKVGYKKSMVEQLPGLLSCLVTPERPFFGSLT